MGYLESLEARGRTFAKDCTDMIVELEEFKEEAYTCLHRLGTAKTVAGKQEAALELANILERVEVLPEDDEDGSG